MKKMLFIAAAAGMMFTSCKKDDDKKGASGGTFKIGSTVYNADIVLTTAGLIAGSSRASSDMSNGSVNIGFSGMTLPATGGTYKITSSAIADDEVSVAFIANKGGNVTSYTPTGNDNKTATVTVSGGKVKVEIPEIWVSDAFTGADSVKASATITQQ